MRKGATTLELQLRPKKQIVALRNEKGSYNATEPMKFGTSIVALRNEKGSYNTHITTITKVAIVALRNEKDATLTCNSNLLSFLYIIVFPVYLVLQFLQNAIGRANILRLSA